jgi:phosphatidylserine/phosphatidylglycerophosphate/cardiolipin synthase-like enzyme
MMSKQNLIFSGDEYFARLTEAINMAELDIHFESYIFELDEVGQHLLVTLKQAALRGVRVHLLVDGVGSLSTAQNYCAILVPKILSFAFIMLCHFHGLAGAAFRGEHCAAGCTLSGGSTSAIIAKWC